jgi:hypothetical protein
MQIPVLIETIAGNGYRAKSGEPLPLSAEAATRESALAKLKAQLQARFRNGAELVPLEVSPEPHPLAEFAGMFKDDPYFEEVLEIMAENRRKMDRPSKSS